jgi:RNA polymerase sigma factor (sigma-70 family)
MNHTNPKAIIDTDVADDDEYCATVRNTLERVLGSRHQLSRLDAADAASEAVLRLLPKLARTRNAYPNARVYAFAVARSAAEDHRRRERAQRGQGARTITTADGAVSARRTVIPFNPVHHDRPTGDEPCEQAVVIDLLRRVLDSTSPADRTLLWRVHADGITVTEAAEQAGLSRSQAIRRLATVVNDIRPRIAA